MDVEVDSDEEGKLENEYLDPKLQVHGRKKAPDGGKNRCFRLQVTDGVNTFWCMEYKYFDKIQDIQVGAKYVLRPPITVRRGIAMLEQGNLQFICAPVQAQV